MFALNQLVALSVIVLSFASPAIKESDAGINPISGSDVICDARQGVSTGSEPGSPCGQPAWGGGSDRVSVANRVDLTASPTRSLPLPVLTSSLKNVISVAPFTSVELRNGGKAILRYGASQRVTLIKGSLDCTEVTVVTGDRLIIDTGKKDCPRGYELEIEIVTPNIKGLAVANGGLLQSLGDFPGLNSISAAVNQGGVLDIRSITVQSVTAAVRSGGRILTKPQTSLVASVADGGVITYWGNATVTSSIKHGGIINKGTAAEADEPVSDLNPCLSAVPSVPSIPPIAPVRSFWW